MPVNLDNMLLTARKNGQKGVVQAFLKKGGIQLDKRDAQGATPLYYASAKGSRDIVKLLLDAGADLCVGWRTSRMSMGFKRAMGSQVVELFCKFFFKLHGKQTTKDMMSGLFAIRCDVFRPIIEGNWDSFELRGWKVLMDLMKYADRKMDVRYYRYDFGVRAEGESHLNPKVVIMTFHQLWGFGKFSAKLVAKVYGVDYKAMYPGE